MSEGQYAAWVLLKVFARLVAIVVMAYLTYKVAPILARGGP